MASNIYIYIYIWVFDYDLSNYNLRKALDLLKQYNNNKCYNNINVLGAATLLPLIDVSLLIVLLLILLTLLLCCYVIRYCDVCLFVLCSC